MYLRTLVQVMPWVFRVCTGACLCLSCAFCVEGELLIQEVENCSLTAGLPLRQAQ